MNFVNPLFFFGALAASVPIFLHLIKRERAQKMEFPTLMFLRRISKKTIRYQKLRHLLLLLLRVLAILLMALAFTRPFRETPQAAVAAGRVTQAHIVLLDNSMSMGAGDRWERAREAAARIIRSAQPGDKAILLEFSDTTIARTQLTSEFGAVLEQVQKGVELTDRPTQYGQALKSAEKFALDAGTGKRTVYLVTDLQKSGRSAEDEFRLGPGIELECVDLGSKDYSNLTVGDVRVIEGEDAQSGTFTLKPSVVNYGTRERRNVRLTLSVDGKSAGDKLVDLGGGEVKGTEFQVPALAPGLHAVVVEVEDPELERDNRFSMTIEARGKTPVISVESGGAGRDGRSPGFFLARALNISAFSQYRLTSVPPARFEAANGGLVLWNNVAGGAAHQKRLRELVAGGGGLIVVVADSSLGPDFNRSFAEWLPVKVDAAPGEVRGKKRPGEDYVLLTDVRIDHPIFRPFAEPHSGTFATARFFRHARLSVAEGAEVIARFDNGDPAIVAAGVGKGRVLVLAFSADDSGNDLPLKSVFAPFWHQMLRHLEQFRDVRRSLRIGDAITPRTVLSEAARRQGAPSPEINQAIVVVDPARQRIEATSLGEMLAVEHAGFYEIRASNLSTRVAVNTVPRESDLAHADAEEWLAGWTSTAAQGTDVVSPDERLTPEEQDRRQRLWRFLLAGVLLLLVSEALLANQYVLKSE